VENEKFTHQLTRDGIKVRKILESKGIKSPSIVGAVKLNSNTWVVPKQKPTPEYIEKTKLKYGISD
jgi:hypothetical protein